jgi:hypothetical protein
VSRTDALSAFDPVLAGRPLTDPWAHAAGGEPRYAPDHALLADLLAIPVRAGSGSESGRLARGVDAWVAHELRRAGFGPDEVWPRATRPRVLPHDVAALLARLPARTAAEVARVLPDISAVGPVDARILGRAYEKQVDVCIARWDRGPELLVSTKTQVSSFAKNLPNRFEEAYGDAANLRGRHPLAAIGFLFVQRDTVRTAEPDAFERTLDMLRKLRDDGGGNGYTATALILVGWDDDGAVAVRTDAVPPDLSAGRFLRVMVERVLAAAPVTAHVAVRERLERRHIPVAEGAPAP